MAAKTTPIPNAIKGFVFIKIKAITVNGTINKYGVMLKVVFMVFNNPLISAVPVVSIFKLMMPKTMIVIVIVGTVVNVIYLMCVNKSVPAMAGAKFVVSLNGDILSPK